MGGGLMQLVAYGAQDIYLTGNPQITFFKVVYRRHTNFSMESIEQTFNGSADFGKKVTCTISRNGDLIHRVYLQVSLPRVSCSGENSKFRWLNWIGHVLIKNVEVEIGGQRIDKHYGDWLHIWNELTQTAGHKEGYANMVGNVPRLTQWIGGAGAAPNWKASCNSANCLPETTLYIPLQFWFCRNPGLALPLIALQYHEVKINIEFRDARQCFCGTGEWMNQTPSLRSASLYVDYIYLDTDERRRFAQVSHEYLIEQLQFTGEETVNTTTNKIKLNFNHPCKELIWTVQPDSNVQMTTTCDMGGPQWFNYTDAVDMTYFTGTPEDHMGGGMAGDDWPESYSVTDAVSDASANGAPNGNAIGQAPNPQWNQLSSDSAVGNLGLMSGLLNNLPLFDAGKNCVFSAKLQLNGHDRFSERDGRYFNLVQPYQHHTNVPAPGINVYSFGLKPEEHQPSGTCNMSRIDNATLQLNLTPEATDCSRCCKVRVYATNYNVLRIMSGMGGLAYSN